MRILLLAHAPSIHTQRWAAALAERGHEIRLLSVVPAPGAAFPGEAVGRASAPAPFLRYLLARGRVRSVLAAWKPDVTVAHFLPNYGFLAALAGARPFALVAWGSDLLVNARRSELHAARARWVLRRAALVHVDAENLADAARGLGAPEGAIWMRPWGVETEALAPGTPWRARAERAADLRILWTRMLETPYDPATFLHALAHLSRMALPFRATIAGDGPLRGALEESSRRLGCAERIRFVGLVDPERLRDLYREHEVYVSMSLTDSTSQSLLEAMAAGLYPVVSDIPGNAPWLGAPVAEGGPLRERGMAVPSRDAYALACALAGVREDADADARVARAAALVRRTANWADTVEETERRLAGLAARAAAGAPSRAGAPPP